MTCRVNVYGVVGFTIMTIGGGLLCIGMGTTEWLTPPWINITYGIFKACSKESCLDLGWSTNTTFGNTLIVTRWILFVATFMWLIGTTCGIVALVRGRGIRVAGALAITSGGLIFAACTAYLALIILRVDYGVPNESDYVVQTCHIPANYFGYSYYVCWASGAVLIVAGAFEAAGYKCQASYQVSPGEVNEVSQFVPSSGPHTKPINW